MINNALFRPLILASIVLVLISSCTKAPTPEEPYNRYKDYILVDEIEMKKHDYTVQLISELPPHVGYNNFAVKVVQKGTSTPVDGAQVAYWPTFKTATATYTSYVEQSYNPHYKYMHHGAVVFTSQADSTQSWHLAVLVREPGQNETDTVIFNLSLKEPVHSRVVEFVHEESPQVFKTYFVTLINPIRPRLGNNTHEVLIFKRDSPELVSPVRELVVFSSSIKKKSSTNTTEYITHVEVPGGHYKGSEYFEYPGEYITTLTLYGSQYSFYNYMVRFDLTVGNY